MQKRKNLIGWAIWICTIGILFWLGKTNFQLRNANAFVIIIILLSFALVIGFSLLYGSGKEK